MSSFVLKYQLGKHMVEISIPEEQAEKVPSDICQYLLDKNAIPAYLETEVMWLLEEYWLQRSHAEMDKQLQQLGKGKFRAKIGSQNEIKRIKDMDEFWKMYDCVFHADQQLQNHLMKIETQMRMDYAKSLRDSEKEIEKLRQTHSREMESICFESDFGDDGDSMSGTNISKIVHMHMQEMTKLETKWKEILCQLKDTQITQYRKFVSDLYNDWKLKCGENPRKINLCLEKYNSNRQIIFEMDTSPPPSVVTPEAEEIEKPTAKYVKNIVSYFKKSRVKIQTPTTPSIPVVSNEHAEGPKLLECIQGSKFINFLIDIDELSDIEATDGRSILSGNNFSEEVEQQDSKVNLFFVFHQDIADSLCTFNPETEISNRTRNIGDLYQNRINALLIPSSLASNSLIWNSIELRNLIHVVTETNAPELHFNDFQTQISSEITRQRDYVITKHSNLPWIHAIFHVLFDSGTDMHNIFQDLHSFQTNNLFIQLPLFPQGMSVDRKILMDNVTSILSQYKKWIRSIRTPNREKNFLKNAIFFLPGSFYDDIPFRQFLHNESKKFKRQPCTT